MYGLKKDADLSFFLGVELFQVCVGRNELILNFDQGVRVTILSDFTVLPGSGVAKTYQEPTQGAAALFPLLHDSVVKAGVTTDGGLRLDFQSGTSLELHDTSDEHESFWLSNGDHKIIV